MNDTSKNPPNPKARYGAQKPDLSLIPPVALHHAALAHEEGARKYGAYNWRECQVEARTYIAAAMRHLCDYADGTERASDSDVHNLGHVIACCAILLDAIEGDHLIDNRPVKGKSAEVLERLKAWKIERARPEDAPGPVGEAPEPYTPRVGDVVRVTATEAELLAYSARAPEYATGTTFAIHRVGVRAHHDGTHVIAREGSAFVLHSGMVELVERPQ